MAVTCEDVAAYIDSPVRATFKTNQNVDVLRVAKANNDVAEVRWAIIAIRKTDRNGKWEQFERKDIGIYKVI